MNIHHCGRRVYSIRGMPTGGPADVGMPLLGRVRKALKSNLGQTTGLRDHPAGFEVTAGQNFGYGTGQPWGKCHRVGRSGLFLESAAWGP